MPKVITKNGQVYYQCQECGFMYKEKEWAEKCETWCKEHKSCNLEITKYAVKEASGKEKWIQKREKREREWEKAKRKRKIKKIIKTSLIFFIVGGAISGLGWYFAAKPSPQESEIIASNGIHWHPELSIKILGQQIEVPANIGLGITGMPLHTHDDTGVIHLEFSGVVKEDDIRLSRFFEIWGKKFTKNCIFDKCSSPDGKVKMLVNGELSSEFENYMMKDGDKIEIIFE